MTEKDNPTFDSDRVAELMDEYTEARTQQKRRAIENQVLAETVWRAEQDDPDSFASFSREEWERISQEVETDDEGIRMLLRKPFVNDL